MVGTLASPKLLVSVHSFLHDLHSDIFVQWRSYHGSRMVPTDRLRYTHHIFLRYLFRRSAYP